MDNAALWLAIKARAASDTGGGGLFAAGANLISGIYPNVGTPDANWPWIVFDIADVAPQHAFTRDVFTAVVRFHLFVPIESNALSDPQLSASNIIKRIYGNWSSSSPSTAPSYGYHRHPLVIASGSWVTGGMLKTGAFVEHEAGALHFIEQYSIALSA